MRGDAAAYEALGLSPGADQADIDRAYRSLIKRYHPDLQGGDAARASEINEAYNQLRRAPDQPAERAQRSSVAEAIYARRASQLVRTPKKRSLLWPILLAALALVLYLKRYDVMLFAENGWAELRSRTEPRLTEGRGADAAPSEPVAIDGPVTASAVRGAVRRATLLHGRGNESLLADESRACHQRLREQPSLERLDGCAAFDDAVLELQRGDPLRDEGPFAATAIASRQISAGTLLSSDYLAIDGRLDRVRGAVQSQLAAPPLADVRTSDAAKVAP